MKRREFITLVGGAAAVAASPVAVRAQQKLPVVGFLNLEPRTPWMHEFLQGLAEAGWTEGSNVTIERRFADGQGDRLPALAADLIRRDARVIAAAGIPALQAARAAHPTIPIVFLVSGDPVKLGLVRSLNRPDGNVTGVTTLGGEIGPKRIELLHELIPKATVFAAIVNPTNPGAKNQSNELVQAATKRGLRLNVLHASKDADIDEAFATAVRLRADGFVVGTNALFSTNLAQLAALGLRHGIPTISQYREFAAAGGLISYGGATAETGRLFGVYAGRVLKGARTADLPVQQATRIEMIVNLKTAKALGLTIPLPLIGRADEVIE